MKYTEEDLKEKTLQAMIAVMQEYSFHNESTVLEFHKEWYNDNLKETVFEEDKISFTYSFLRRKLDWEEFCDLTGIDYYSIANGYKINDDDVFYITESKAKQFNLI